MQAADWPQPRRCSVFSSSGLAAASTSKRRLEERFPSAQFAYSTAYNALRRMVKEGLVRVVEAEQVSRGEATYEVTDNGRSQFLAWIREPSRLPMLREELHAKIALSSPRDLPRLVEVLIFEEQACAYKIEELRRQTMATPPEAKKPLPQREWSELMALAVIHGEAAFWTGRIAQLSALRRYLTGLQDEAQRRTIAEDRLRMQRKGRAA